MMNLLEDNQKQQCSTILPFAAGAILLLLTGLLAIFTRVFSPDMLDLWDFPTLLVYILVCCSLVLLNRKRHKQEIIPFLRKIVILYISDPVTYRTPSGQIIFHMQKSRRFRRDEILVKTAPHQYVPGLLLFILHILNRCNIHWSKLTMSSLQRTRQCIGCIHSSDTVHTCLNCITAD